MKKSTKQIVITIFIVITSFNIKAQTLKRNYYTHKNQVQEEYYVNANGEKVGIYKSYYENGLIFVEANYKNGVMEGTYKEYYPGSTKSCLEKTTIMKNGEVEGLTTFYALGCNVMSAQGNCSSYFVRQGKWTIIEKQEGTMPEGFEYLTYTCVYKDGKVIEEPTIIYYHPSKKICSERKGNIKYTYSPKGKTIGEEIFDDSGKLKEEKYTYESGKVAQLNKYYRSGNDSIAEFNWWYENGNVKLIKKDVNGESVVYENYNEDGSKSDKMKLHEADKIRDKQIEEDKMKKKNHQQVKFNGFIGKADSIEIINPEQGLVDYKAILKDVTYDYEFLSRGKDTTNSAFLHSKIKELNQKISVTEIRVAKRKKLNTLSIEQNSKIKLKTDQFQKRFGSDNSYPFGEPIFKVVDQHLVKMYTEFIALSKIKSDKSLEDLTIQGDKIVAAFDKILSLTDDEAKDLNKKLKKVKTPEEETLILGF